MDIMDGDSYDPNVFPVNVINNSIPIPRERLYDTFRSVDTLCSEDIETPSDRYSR